MSNTIDQIKAFFPIQTGDNNKFLRKKSDKVDIFDGDLRDFCDILVELMYAYDGVGLAAPQVAKNIRIIAVTQRKENKKPHKKDDKELIGEIAMINPEILEHSKEKIKREEGCLSVPGLRGDVERWSWIVLKYQDKKGKFHVQKYTGFNAVIIQHEVDHLDGILFTDKVIGEIKESNDE